MKKLFLFFITLLLFTQNTWAQIRRSTIEIKLRNDKLLTVVLDGRHYKRYGRTITFGDIPAGTHDIKVYRYYPEEQDPRYNDMGRARAVLLYKGRMRIDPATTYYCTVDPQYKTMSIRESREIYYGDNESTFRIDEQPNFEEDRNNKWREKDSEYDIERSNERNKSTTSRDPNLLSNEQLTTLKSAVDERISNTDKVNLMQNFLQSKKVSIEQVKTMMGWLSFESNKLQLAKYCYPKTIDQDNYLQISNLLDFQSSKRELEKLMFDNKKNEANNRPNNPKTLTTVQMSQLANAVQQKVTDTDKQKLMQQNLENNSMSTMQVATMMDWLTFEGSKLEFAKWAYPKVNDKISYADLKNKFTFLSSKKAIDDLMMKK